MTKEHPGPLRRTMIKSTVGHVRRTSYDLPDAKNLNHTHSYEVVPSPAAKSGRSFIETNRQAIMNGCITAGEARKFANEHPDIIVKPASKSKASFVPMNDLIYGIKSKESEDISAIIQARFMSFSTENADYPDFSNMKIKGKLPLPRDTRASLGMDVRTHSGWRSGAKDDDPDHLFKMSKFKKVDSVLCTQPNANRHGTTYQDDHILRGATISKLIRQGMRMALRVRGLLGGALCCFFAASTLQSPTAATLSSDAAASAPIVRGVAPEEQQQYAALECVVDGKRQALSPARVNDDYCDCDDGADEPGTSACSHLLSSVFYCGNDGYFPKKIPTSRVNDGICDCCDGTDEFHDVSLCANTCAADAVEFRTAAQTKLAAVEAGFKKRQAIIDGEINTYFDDALETEKETAQTLQALEKLKEHVAVHQAREERKEQRTRLQLARKAQAAAEQQAGHEGGDSENKETVCVADEASGKTCEASSSASIKHEGAEDSLDVDDFDEDESVDANEAQQHQQATYSDEVDAESHNVKAQVELADGTRVSLADYLRMDRATTVKRKKPKTADQMRREDFLGPLFNGDAEGQKRVGLYALRTVGLLISPVRGVVELVLFYPRTIWDLAMITFKVDRRRLPSFASLQASVLDAPWFRRLGDGQVYRAYHSVAWGAKVAWDAPIFAYNYLFPQLDESVVSREAESLRKVVQEIDADIEELTRARDEKREAAAKDYGPERAYFALNEQCIEKKIEVSGGSYCMFSGCKYTYKFCAFRDIKQDYTLLGKWDAWSSTDNGDTDYAHMQFIKGQKCWNGPERSVRVRLACGNENEIVSVDEPSTCVYEMLVQTPLACTQDVVTQAQHEVAFWK